MKLFGFDTTDGDERELPRTLREATLLVNADELRAIAGFLLRCAEQIDVHGARFGHEHLGDHLRGTALASTTEDAELIVVRRA
jgi:hypothetical protein